MLRVKVEKKSNAGPFSNRTARSALKVVLIALLVLVLLPVLVLMGGTAWIKHAMRDSLPVLDGQATLPGLSATVETRRDAHGVPHIEAATLDDLFEAQGYVTAQDRLWQMDMARRNAGGELAELLGGNLVAHDRTQRILQMRPAAERLAAALKEHDRRIYEDYARGVNAYIAQHQDHLPAEFRILGYRPQPWKPVDSMLIALSMVQLLDQHFEDKLSREGIEAKLGPTLAADLYPTGSWRDHPPASSIPDLTQPQPDIPDVPLDESQTWLRDLLRLPRNTNQATMAETGNCRECAPGSNQWVVSGAHTASHKPILSNDMHLNHGIPNIWYEVDLHAGSFHVAGVSIPGTPLVVAGHNEHIAWGFTALYGDTQDVYIEQVNAQGQYLAPEGWRDLTRTRETIKVRFGRDVAVDVATTTHGAVITPMIANEKRVLTLKWNAYDPRLAGFPLFDIDTASNWTEFRAAAAKWWGPTQNIVYSDDQGHIGYQAVGAIPLRPGGISGVPIAVAGPGSNDPATHDPATHDLGTKDPAAHDAATHDTAAHDSAAHDPATREWTGYVPFDALPTALDPAGGVLATANSRVTPDGYPYPLTLGWASPYRNQRIWKWLEGRDRLTSGDMLTLEGDVYSELNRDMGQRFAYAIDHSAGADKRLAQAADLLRNWDGMMTVDSPAAAIVAAAKAAFWPLVLQPKLGELWRTYEWPESSFAEEELVFHASAAWLPPGYATWNELLSATVARGLENAGAPADLKSWRYGSSHVVEVSHPLYSMLPFFKNWTGSGVAAQSGDGSTVKQVGRSFGPSQRFTIDWSDIDGATENIVMGESGNPLSPYYRDQWPFWLSGKTFALPFSEAAVAAAATHTLRLVP